MQQAAHDYVVTEQREAPLLLSMPHGGTELPPSIVPRLTSAGLEVADTDWWMDRLYDFAANLGATVVRTTLSRYVIDMNRDPSGASLYPGQATTELCPVQTFDGVPIYLPGQQPDDTEIAERRQVYFAAYHQTLAQELARLKARHGYAILYDCHSIRSVVPRLFAGRLPVFNIGTNSGLSCAPALEKVAVDAFASDRDFDHVLNGRFKGGWITRHYGQPKTGVHAIQLELAQRAYMDEAPPWRFDVTKADRLRPTLQRVLEAILGWAQRTLGA